MKRQRLCIYPQDISNILGKSLSQSRRILSHILSVYGKTHKQYLSVREFAEYTGLAEEDIRQQLT